MGGAQAALPRHAYGVRVFTCALDALSTHSQGSARLATVRGAAEALLLAVVSDAARATPVCAQLLAHCLSSVAAIVEAAAAGGSSLPSPQSLLACDAALSAMGLSAADAVALGVLTPPALAAWWLGDAARLFWACGVSEPARSSGLQGVDSVGGGRVPLALGALVPAGATPAQRAAVALLQRRLLWAYGCCMGAASAELNAFTLRLCATVASQRGGPAGVALAAIATATSIVQTLPHRRSGGGGAVAELPVSLVLDIATAVATAMPLCAEASSHEACLALLGATLARCGAETTLRVAGPVLAMLGQLLASAGSAAGPGFTRACIGLVRAIVQAGHDAIRAASAAVAPAGGALHGSAVSALLVASGGGGAAGGGPLRLHESQDGPEARARLAAAASSAAVADLCGQLQPLWAGVLPFVGAACAAAGGGRGGSGEEDGDDPLALAFLSVEALRILWMVSLGCASAGGVVAPGAGGASLMGCFGLLPRIVERGGEPLGSAVAVAWALALRLSSEGGPAGGVFAPEPAGGPGSILAAICDAALAAATPSQVRFSTMAGQGRRLCQQPPFVDAQVPRAVALLETAVAIAVATPGAPLLRLLQVG